MKFTCKGHKNILSLHRNTFEFTKNTELSLNGDCIIGVECDFSNLNEILKWNKAKMIIKTKNNQDEIIFEVNKEFNDKNEIVIRTTNFISNRTLGINSNKAAKDLNQELINELKNPETILMVEINENT